MRAIYYQIELSHQTIKYLITRYESERMTEKEQQSLRELNEMTMYYRKVYSESLLSLGVVIRLK